MARTAEALARKIKDMKNDKATDISIDIETLGTDFDAPVISIGAAAFNRRTGKVHATFYKKVNLNSAIKAGRVNGDTLAWWMQQSDAARKVFQPNEGETWSLATVLAEFTTWGRSLSTQGSQVWGNGATFDITILEHAYRVGCVGLREFWKLTSIRDVRTIVDAAQDVTKGDPWAAVRRVGTHYNALDDAVYQAALIHNCFRMLREHTDEEI